MSLPCAVYNSNTVSSYKLTVDPVNSKYETTYGRTTGPSSYVLHAGQVDHDGPSKPKINVNGELTFLSRLRCQITGLQDDINEFLTSQMELSKNKKLKDSKEEEKIQNEITKLLDGGDEEEE